MFLTGIIGQGTAPIVVAVYWLGGFYPNRTSRDMDIVLN
jgi:hypothetical protein